MSPTKTPLKVNTKPTFGIRNTPEVRRKKRILRSIVSDPKLKLAQQRLKKLNEYKIEQKKQAELERVKEIERLEGVKEAITLGRYSEKDYPEFFGLLRGCKPKNIIGIDKKRGVFKINLNKGYRSSRPMLLTKLTIKKYAPEIIKRYLTYPEKEAFLGEFVHDADPMFLIKIIPKEELFSNDLFYKFLKTKAKEGRNVINSENVKDIVSGYLSRRVPVKQIMVLRNVKLQEDIVHDGYRESTLDMIKINSIMYSTISSPKEVINSILTDLKSLGDKKIDPGFYSSDPYDHWAPIYTKRRGLKSNKYIDHSLVFELETLKEAHGLKKLYDEKQLARFYDLASNLLKHNKFSELDSGLQKDFALIYLNAGKYAEAKSEIPANVIAEAKKIVM